MSDKILEPITNSNFDDVEDFIVPYPEIIEDRLCKYERDKVNDCIVFSTRFIACPCIYYYLDNDKFCFSFDVDNLIEFYNDNNIPLEEYSEEEFYGNEVLSHLKLSIRERYKYKIACIENWSEVRVYRDGHFEVKENDFIPYQLEIKDNPEKFLNFILKYKRYVDYYIDNKKFIPTITGGLDTRTFIPFYKKRVNEFPEKSFYLKAVKPDGKNDVEKGDAEVEIAERLGKRIGLTERVESTVDKFTLSGMFNESARFLLNPNNPDFIFKYIQHSYSSKDLHSGLILPFLDNDFLQFKQEKNLTRTLLAILLIPDLLHMNLIGTGNSFKENKNGYLFVRMYGDLIPRANDIIKSWGKETLENFYKEFNK